MNTYSISSGGAVSCHNWQYTGVDEETHYSGECKRQYQCKNCDIIEWGPCGHPGGEPNNYQCYGNRRKVVESTLEQERINRLIHQNKHDWELTGREDVTHYSGESRREYKCCICYSIEWGTCGYPGGPPNSVCHGSERERIERIKERERIDAQIRKNAYVTAQVKKLKEEEENRIIRERDIKSDIIAKDGEKACIHCEKHRIKESL